MYYRRKIILALIQLLGGELDKIRLQKLLFLFNQNNLSKVYDFVPYRFGCFSFSANADLTTMCNKGLLKDDSTKFLLLDSTDYLKLLKKEDLKKILEIKTLYGNMTSSSLMKHTYVNFPYWATKSEKAKEILTTSEFDKIKNAIKKDEDTVLYTIGYEGISLEEYLNRLIKNDVKVLVDVRNNPLSMKYGFSKSLLKRFVENLGIQYIHIPEVGIQSEQRQELNSQLDYDTLFESYKQNNLTKTSSAQNEIFKLLVENKKIALTCFEANICQCHRKHLAEAITTIKGFDYKLVHI